MIVALMDERTFKVFEASADIPPGVPAYTSVESLAECDLTTEQLDGIRARLVGDHIGRADDKLDAARRLWYVLQMNHRVEPQSINDYEGVKDKFGNRKIRVKPIEVIQLLYRPGRDHMSDFFFKKMATQAKTIMAILQEDGRGIWSHEEAERLLMVSKDRIPTKQGVAQVFAYYKPELFAKKMLGRMTYDEFLTKKEFKGMDIFNKEDAAVVEEFDRGAEV